jgi:heptosyltransferase-2
MHVLIVKHGALGDVVRTSYFAKPLKDRHGAALRLSWITATTAVPLLQFHPALDDIWTTFDEARAFAFDKVYSLDDDMMALESVAGLATRSLTGAYLNAERQAAYTDDAAEWFDMGLLSRFGKSRADALKKSNQQSHAEIFARIFGVPRALPRFYGDPAMEEWALSWIGNARPAIGLNPFAGGRWPSKQLPLDALRALIGALLHGETPFGSNCHVVLLGAGEDHALNASLVAEFDTKRLRAANTDDSPLRLAALVKFLDYLVTSDSLPMHLALSQGVRTLAFFAPTSAAEIDDFGILTKLASLSRDYCSYNPCADNTSITAARILSALRAD